MSADSTAGELVEEPAPEGSGPDRVGSTATDSEEKNAEAAASSEPVEVEESSDSAEPESGLEPEASTEPQAPVELDAPAELEAPAKLEAPAELEAPTEPAAPAQQAEPTAPVEPTVPAEPTVPELTPPAEPTLPDSTPPAEPTRPEATPPPEPAAETTTTLAPPSLSPAKARERLRAHRLADPNGYLLLLVEAAQLAAPAGVEPHVWVTLSRPIVVEFTSIELEHEQLTQLLGSVFGEHDGLEGETLARARLMRMLGLAVNAGLSVSPAPAQVSVAQLDASGHGMSARYLPDGTIELFEVQHEERARPYLRYEILFGIYDNLSLSDERATLTGASRFARFPIEINGWRLSKGLEAGLGFDGAKPHASSRTAPVMLGGEQGQQVGVASNYAADTPAILSLQTRGVLTELVELEGMRPGFRALVDVDLPKDLGQHQVLRGEDYDAVLEAVRQAHEALPKVPLTPSGGLPPPPPSEPGMGASGLVYAGIVVACVALFALGPRLLNGPWKSLAPRAGADDPRAQLQCSTAQPNGCMQLAQLELERGGKGSLERARERFTTACERMPEACAQRDALGDALLAGQRWEGEFSCGGEPYHAVFDVAADDNHEARFMFWVGRSVYVAQLGLELERNWLTSEFLGWEGAAPQGLSFGEPHIQGEVSRASFVGELPLEGCGSIELGLRSGALPN